MNRFQSCISAAVMAVGIAGGALASLVTSSPAQAANFSDINGHWARTYIEALADAKIVTGFSDGTFKPDQPVTRAEFAALVQKAFKSTEVRDDRSFNDVPGNYWAQPMIEEAYATGFMSGYPHRNFNPEEAIPRVQVLVSLVSGLHLTEKNLTHSVLNTYVDADQIPDYALDKVAAATEKGIVVNYPNMKYLNPNQVATRADVAALIYQAKASKGELPVINNHSEVLNYLVSTTSEKDRLPPSVSNNEANQNQRLKLAKDREFNVIYTPSEKVVITPNETVNMTLLVGSDIKNSQGEVLVPHNSVIFGQLIPRYDGSEFLGNQFVAQKLAIGTQTYNNIDANSSLIKGQQLSSINPETLQKAAISSEAQSVIEKASGKRANAEEKLDTALTNPGANKQQDKLIVIDQKTDWKLTLGSDFYVNNVADAASTKNGER